MFAADPDVTSMDLTMLISRLSKPLVPAAVRAAGSHAKAAKAAKMAQLRQLHVAGG